MTIAEEAEALGMAVVETFQRDTPATVEVYDTTIAPNFSVLRPDPEVLLVRVAAEPGEHPGDLARRALVAARRAQMRAVEP